MENTSNYVQIKRKISAIIMLVSAVLFTAIGSYAFFTSNNDVVNQEAVIRTGSMALIFNDGNDGVSAAIRFGDSITKTFEIENSGTVDTTTDMIFFNLINTYTEGSLTYTLLESTAEAGQYSQIVSDKKVPLSTKRTNETLASDLRIAAGQTKYYRLVITYNHLDTVDQNSDVEAVLNTMFRIGDYKPKTLIDDIAATSHGMRTDFDNMALTDEGVFEAKDDYGTSYYYRGAVVNNYVKFAGFYWRIIRINGDNSMRIIYDGTSPHTNGEGSADRLAFTYQPFNAGAGEVKLTGWMYGNSSGSKEQAQSNDINSYAKDLTESWYKTHILDAGYDEAISDNIFCNDRSIPDKNLVNLAWNTGLGYGTNFTIFGPGYRSSVYSDNTIMIDFSCQEKNDSFTAKDTVKGNGKSAYPVGLITTDEVIAAGSKGYYDANNDNDKFYLANKSYILWTMSPTAFAYNSVAGVGCIWWNGKIASCGTNASTGEGYPIGIQPVVNLKYSYVTSMIGTGSIDDPYRQPDVII